MNDGVFDTSFLFAIACQTTLALSLGALAQVLWRRRPARAHFALSLALIASVTLPAAWFGVRYAGWGVLPHTTTIEGESSPPSSTHVESGDTPAPQPGDAAPTRNYARWMVIAWICISVLLALRLALGLLIGIRMLAAAHPLVSERLYAIVESAKSSLGIKRPPIAFVTDALRCPAIWCWAIHPSILLPSAMARQPERWSANSI